MRQYMRDTKRYSRIAIIIALSLGLQGCAFNSRMPMDYLPDTAKVLIEKDIQNGHQVDEEGIKPVSVMSMLSSLLGLDNDEKQIKIPPVAREPITEISFETATLIHFPIPQKKPVRMAAIQEILKVIELELDEQILLNVKQKTQSHAGSGHIAEISVGPITGAENMQLASLQAMAKASSIGHGLKDDFEKVSIKFDPLQPTGTLRIVIKGKKQHA